MSRFGIRKKLKSMLGMGGGSNIVLHSVTFVLPDGREKTIEVEEHYSLLMAADTNGITISTGRRAGGTCPDGGCASCRLEVIDQTGLSPMKDGEKRTLEAAVRGDPHEGRERQPQPPTTPNTRLGCHTKIVGSGARIQIAQLFDEADVRGTDD